MMLPFKKRKRPEEVFTNCFGFVHKITKPSSALIFMIYLQLLQVNQLYDIQYQSLYQSPL